MRWLECLFATALLASGAGASAPEAAISVEDVPARNVIRVINGSGADMSLYYNHGRSFGALQMFLVRFRDRNGQIFPLDGTIDGWFTPKSASATLGGPPEVESFAVPAHSAIEFERNVRWLASWTRWTGARDTGPCEVQLRLSVRLGGPAGPAFEADTAWQPGPCPATALPAPPTARPH